MEQLDHRARTTHLIHYVFRVDPERIACMPNMTEFHLTPFHPNYQRTNETRAVTCPECKKTETYKKAHEALNPGAPKQFPENE